MSFSEPERAPGTLMLHLTGRCNLECEHCYMDGGPTRRESLDRRGVVDALDQCSTLGVGRVYLTGGEPFLYRDVLDVLEHAKRLPDLGVTVCTNGTIATARHVDLLAELRARVHISVDGDAEYHDRFRRSRGALRATQAGIEAFVRGGVPVTIVSTIARDNRDALATLARWSFEIGASELRIQPLLDLGRGREIADRRLDSAALDTLLLELSDLANVYGSRGLKCRLVGVTRRFLLAHPCGAYVCNGGGCHRRIEKEIKKIVVREDGTILPEATNLSPVYAIGNLNEDESLTSQVTRYLEHGYSRFDRLCRAAYDRFVPSWSSPIVPWDQILAEFSHEWCEGDAPSANASASCGTCETTPANREGALSEATT